MGALLAVRQASVTRRLLAFVLLAATAGPLAAGEVKVEEDLTYGKGGGVELKLDLARPVEGEGPYPALVLIHGGGWSMGQRKMHRAQMMEAAERGYVAVTISYRLVKPSAQGGKIANPFPAQVHDAKCAVRWLRANAAKYKIDPERIGAAGGSAGGHLSLLVGLTDPEASLEGEGGHPKQSSRVQAVVNIFGPTDLARCHATSEIAAPLIANLLEGTPQEVLERYAAASPVTYVSADDPPVLTLHGTKDRVVPVEQATLLDERMKAAGARHTLLVLEGQDHGFSGDAANKAFQAMWDFFDEHLKPAK